MCAAIGGAWFVPAFLQCCNRLSIIVMASVFLSFNATVSSTTDRNMDKLAGQTNIDCSDEFSRVNISAAQAQMEESQSLLTSSTLFISMTIVWIVAEICCGICCIAIAKAGTDCSCRCSNEHCAEEFKEYLKAYKHTN